MLVLQSRRTSRLRRRLTILGLILLPVAGYFGWQFTRDHLLYRYRAWKQEKALGRARELIAKKDPAGAKLELDIALDAVPGSPEAMRVAADFFEMVGAAQAVSIRRQIVDFAPESIPDRLAMVATALRFHDLNAAHDALTGFTPAQLAQPAVLRAHLSYALATGNRPVADGLFDRLASLATPDDDMKALHALLLRQHPDRQKSAAANQELETLAQNPRFALSVNRTLFSEAVAARNYPDARRYAALVSADPAATFADQLNEANLQVLVDKAPFEGVFARLAPRAAASGPAAAEFVRWLIIQNKSAEAARWLAGIPATLATTPDVGGVRADLAVATRDWDRFGQLIEEGAWGPIPPEVARLALAAHVVGTRSASVRKEVWDEAVAAAGTNLNTYRVLLRIAGAWQWEAETESLLWAVLQVDPGQAWAHATLLGVYRKRGDGKKMLEVMSVLKGAAPTSTTYRHDWALLSLLISPGPEWDEPKTIAKEVYLADPTNPNYATTYAFALTQAGKPEDARAVLEKLPVAEREYPLRAPYMSYVYGFCRRPAECNKYAALVGNAPVLREERLLVQQGVDALTRPLSRPLPEPKPRATPKTAPKT